MSALFVPLERSRCEIALFRVMFALVVLRPFSKFSPWPSSQPMPTGLARVVDLSFLSEPAWYQVTYGVLILALLAYVFGKALGVVLPILFAITTAVFTLQNSQSGVAHHLHVIPLALLGQVVGWWRFRLSNLDANGVARTRARSAQELMVHDSLQCVVALYFVAGLSKLVETGGSWVGRAASGALWIVQGHDEEFYSRVAGSTLLPENPIALFLASHPNFASAFFGAGLLIELLAPLALANRISSIVGGLLLVAFHLANGALMNLWFLNNVFVLLVVVANVPWMVCSLRGRAAGGSREPFSSAVSSRATEASSTARSIGERVRGTSR